MKKIFWICIAIASIGLYGCANNTDTINTTHSVNPIEKDTIAIVGDEYYESFDIGGYSGDAFGADQSGNVVGEFSRYTSPEYGVSFEFVSKRSVKYTGEDNDITILRTGNIFYKNYFSPDRPLLRIFTGKDIGASAGTLAAYFLSGYNNCMLVKSNILRSRRLGRKDFWPANRFNIHDSDNRTMYELSIKGPVQNGMSSHVACPYASDNYNIPLLFIHTLHPDVVFIGFGNEGCGGGVDCSDTTWVPTITFLKNK